MLIVWGEIVGRHGEYQQRDPIERSWDQQVNGLVHQEQEQRPIAEPLHAIFRENLRVEHSLHTAKEKQKADELEEVVRHAGDQVRRRFFIQAALLAWLPQGGTEEKRKEPIATHIMADNLPLVESVVEADKPQHRCIKTIDHSRLLRAIQHHLVCVGVQKHKPSNVGHRDEHHRKAKNNVEIAEAQVEVTEERFDESL